MSFELLQFIGLLLDFRLVIQLQLDHLPVRHWDAVELRTARNTCIDGTAASCLYLEASFVISDLARRDEGCDDAWRRNLRALPVGMAGAVLFAVALWLVVASEAHLIPSQPAMMIGATAFLAI